MACIDVIGIDPGSINTGWGIVREMSGVLELVDCGVIHPKTNLESAAFSKRLAHIYKDLCTVISKYMPQHAAIEQVFISQNAKSALKLGQARGVAVASCAAYGLDIFDYEPTLVKKSIVGVGRADKEQVAFMVKRLLNARGFEWPMDTTDALGVAICHLSQIRLQTLATFAYTKKDRAC